MLENNFFPYQPFRGLLDAYEALQDASLFDYLDAAYGRKPESTTSCTLEIVRASAEQASYLDIITGDPMFYMSAYFLDAEGQPLVIRPPVYRRQPLCVQYLTPLCVKAAAAPQSPKGIKQRPARHRNGAARALLFCML